MLEGIPERVLSEALPRLLEPLRDDLPDAPADETEVVGLRPRVLFHVRLLEVRGAGVGQREPRAERARSLQRLRSDCERKIECPRDRVGEPGRVEARRVGLVGERGRGSGRHVEPDRRRAGVRQREGLVREVVGLALHRLRVREVGVQRLDLLCERVAAGIERRRVLRNDRDLLGVQYLHEIVGDERALHRVIDRDSE